MRIISEPTVYLVGSQTIDQTQIDRFLEDHQVSTWTTDTSVAGQKLAEVAGRICYMSFGKPRPGGNKAYLDRILESAHGSVLEHAVFNFIVTGVSRSFTHELVRHRAGFGYSQLSQRYVDESIADFVEPPAIADDKELHEVWRAAVTECQAAYTKLVDALLHKFQGVESKTLRRKLARQAARSVLPNATETKIFITGNARAWRHFIEMRANEHAETEIRRVALKILQQLKKAAPNLFGDYQIVELEDGTTVAQTGYRKV